MHIDSARTVHAEGPTLYPSNRFLQAAETAALTAPPSIPNKVLRRRHSFDQYQSAGDKLAATPALTTRPLDPNKVLRRRKSIDLSPLSKATGIYDRLGERVSEATVNNLADVVKQRVDFKEGIGPVGYVAQRLGLTRKLALTTHLVTLIHLAFKDAELENIARMGLITAIKNPKTRGIPPEGFKPLYDLLDNWGITRQGELKYKDKLEARKLFIKDRETDMAYLKQTSRTIAARLPAATKNLFPHTVKAKTLDDESFLSLLIIYFTQCPKPKVAIAE
jgi:hypothetical protein